MSALHEKTDRLESEVKELKQVLSLADQSIKEQISNSREYRDNQDYNTEFNEFVCRLGEKSPHLVGTDKFWPDDFEPRPLQQALKRLKDLKSKICTGEYAQTSYKALSAAILHAMQNCIDCIIKVEVLSNTYPQLVRPKEIGLPEHEVLETTLFAFGHPKSPDVQYRPTVSENYLESLTHSFRQNANELTRFCTQTLDRIEAARRLDVDRNTFTVSWKGQQCEVGNKKEFHLMEVLARTSGNYVPFADLATEMGGDSFDSISHVKSRLVRILSEAGLSDLADAIKTQSGHYGLILD